MLTMANEKAFEDRKLDIETATQMGARFEAGRFLFDYQDKGVTRFRKVRTQDKTFWIEPAGQPLQLWNLDALRDLPSALGETLTITEGEFDAIAVQQAFGGFVVSVPNGTTETRSTGPVLVSDDTRFSYLWDENERLIKEIDQFDRIILCTDSDKPGRILRDELAMRIGEARCWRVSFPDGCKDANDVLMKGSTEALRRALHNAVPMRPGCLVRPSESPPNPNKVYYSSGWGGFDKHAMFMLPELCVVTGEPGHGKSQWVRSLTFHLAEAHKWKIAYLTPEDPPHRLVRDMERFAKRRNLTGLMSGKPQWNPSAAEEAANKAWVDQHFMISVPPEDEALTLDMVEAEMASAALHHGCKVFVIDPWNEISHDRKGRPDTEYIEQALLRIKKKARRYGMILIIVAHPRKIEPGKKPNLYDISGSANWRNRADHGIIVHRAVPDADIVEVIVEKIKDHENMGNPGSVWMKFFRWRADYEDVTSSSSSQG